MNFSESGLPKHPLVEAAFIYSYNTLDVPREEHLRDYTKQVETVRHDENEMLDLQKEQGGMPDEMYKQFKEQLNREMDNLLKKGPERVEEQVEADFAMRRVGGAKEVAKSENPTPETVAAALLVDSVRSPRDFKKVEEKFGADVAGILADVLNIDSYPTRRAVLVPASSEESRRLYLALMISSFEQTTAQVEKIRKEHPNNSIIFPPGQEEMVFENAKTVWGNDKKLDARFVEAFNHAGEAVRSTFRVEVAKDGGLELVKDAVKDTPTLPPVNPPKNPKGPKGPGGSGDVF